MKHLIFMPSIAVIRGECRLANDAGFSRFDRAISFLYSDLYLPFRGYYGPESRLERAVIDNGKGKSLFVCPQMSITAMHKEIATTNGFVILVDEQDFHLSEKYKWRAANVNGKVYARAAARELILMHRLIFNLEDRSIHVDHINGNGLDNRRSNLRLCTHAQNMANRRKHKNNTHGYKGVRWRPKDRMWYAEIRASGKKIYLGAHDTKIKAARAYDAAAKELHGEFASLNFKQESK